MSSEIQPNLNLPTNIQRPLDGIKVLDLTRWLPGPVATLILADMGAQVIKIEEPEHGDPARTFATKPNEVGPLFSAVNRNKQSLTLNLKEPLGLAAFHRLVAQSDVIVESFRPGVAEKLGIDYQHASEVNPTIIYCSLSGYGQQGSMRNKAGHDVNYIARAGLLGMTLDDKGKPVIPGIQVADMSTALMAVIAIQSALLARAKSGSGQQIDLSMTDLTLWLMPTYWSQVLAGTTPPEPRNELTGLTPYYNIYRTKDGHYMTLGAIEPKLWEQFCDAIKRPDLKRRQFDEGKKREDLINLLKRHFGSKTQAEWCEVFAGADACCEPVLTFAEAVAQPRADTFVQKDTAGREYVRNPIRFSSIPFPPAQPAPGLGEHTETILRQFGFSDVESAKLAKRGVTKREEGIRAGFMRFVSRAIRSVTGR